MGIDNRLRDHLISRNGGEAFDQSKLSTPDFDELYSAYVGPWSDLEQLLSESLEVNGIRRVEDFADSFVLVPRIGFTEAQLEETISGFYASQGYERVENIGGPCFEKGKKQVYVRYDRYMGESFLISERRVHFEDFEKDTGGYEALYQAIGEGLDRLLLPSAKDFYDLGRIVPMGKESSVLYKAVFHNMVMVIMNHYEKGVQIPSDHIEISNEDSALQQRLADYKERAYPAILKAAKRLFYLIGGDEKNAMKIMAENLEELFVSYRIGCGEDVDIYRKGVRHIHRLINFKSN